MLINSSPNRTATLGIAGSYRYSISFLIRRLNIKPSGKYLLHQGEGRTISTQICTTGLVVGGGCYSKIYKSVIIVYSRLCFVIKSMTLHTVDQCVRNPWYDVNCVVLFEFGLRVFQKLCRRQTIIMKSSSSHCRNVSTVLPSTKRKWISVPSKRPLLK